MVQAHGQSREATDVGQTCGHCYARVSSKSGYNVASFAISELDLVILLIAMPDVYCLLIRQKSFDIHWYIDIHLYIDRYSHWCILINIGNMSHMSSGPSCQLRRTNTVQLIAARFACAGIASSTLAADLSGPAESTWRWWSMCFLVLFFPIFCRYFHLYSIFFIFIFPAT